MKKIILILGIMAVISVVSACEGSEKNTESENTDMTSTSVDVSPSDEQNTTAAESNSGELPVVYFHDNEPTTNAELVLPYTSSSADETTTTTVDSEAAASSTMATEKLTTITTVASQHTEMPSESSTEQENDKPIELPFVPAY